VFGGGFALVGLGELIHLKAVSDQTSSFAGIISNDCPDGCMTGQLDHRLESNAKVASGIAIGVLAVGAATIVTES
jgi:hypothetical protein